MPCQRARPPAGPLRLQLWSLLWKRRLGNLKSSWVTSACFSFPHLSRSQEGQSLSCRQPAGTIARRTRTRSHRWESLVGKPLPSHSVRRYRTAYCVPPCPPNPPRPASLCILASSCEAVYCEHLQIGISFPVLYAYRLITTGRQSYHRPSPPVSRETARSISANANAHDRCTRPLRTPSIRTSPPWRCRRR
jgi:hypothetical protein